MRGWVEYFKLADMKGLLERTDKWARRRIRAVYWKQWKKIKTKYRMLKALGMEHWKAKELENGESLKPNLFKENNSQARIYIHA